MTVIPEIELTNGVKDSGVKDSGVKIPQLGFGVYQIPPAETTAATLAALEVGYRHIDTAEMYRNEKEVGAAIRASGIDRSEVFVTSKLNNTFHDPDRALAAFDQTLADLDIGYLDLFLIHWPMPGVGDYVETWKAMEQMLASGNVRAIGVSNFKPNHIRRLIAEATVVPAVNQVEIHPYLTQDDVRAVDSEFGIATEAWSPIAQGKVLDDPTITGIAKRIDRTPAQVTLRWHIQRGDIVFPKSVTRSRIEENFRLFDFDLTDDDVAAITALNRDERTGPDPANFNWIPKS
jgi:2,5-diketo-D-gluconate reductase A